MVARTFCAIRRRSRAVAAELSAQGFLPADDQPLCSEGIERLIQQMPTDARSTSSILERAIKQLRKVAYALPSLGAGERAAILARHGYCHEAAIRSSLRSRLPRNLCLDEKQLIRLIRCKFREAVAARKQDSTVEPDHMCLLLVKDHLVAAGDVIE